MRCLLCPRLAAEGGKIQEWPYDRIYVEDLVEGSDRIHACIQVGSIVWLR